MKQENIKKAEQWRRCTFRKSRPQAASTANYAKGRYLTQHTSNKGFPGQPTGRKSKQRKQLKDASYFLALASIPCLKPGCNRKQLSQNKGGRHGR